MQRLREALCVLAQIIKFGVVLTGTVTLEEMREELRVQGADRSDALIFNFRYTLMVAIRGDGSKTMMSFRRVLSMPRSGRYSRTSPIYAKP